MEYAILDIETTGGKYNEEGITEIAIYRFDGTKVVDQFASLVNPERSIQPFVVNLTGINSEMLRNAPKFYEVAKRIIEITDGAVLVAHNAKFDNRILTTEFDRLGYNFEKETLCTVELAKKLIPDMPSYSLGKLVRSLGIPLSDRHRAQGDAKATVELFKILLVKDTNKDIVKQFVKRDPKKQIDTKLLEIIKGTPSEVGVYYMHNEQGDIIYIGKSKNIKKRLTQHFTSDNRKSKAIQLVVTAVTFEKTGNELIALLQESDEIKKHKPKYNRALRKTVFNYQLGSFKDELGYINLKIEKADARKKAITTFSNYQSAKNNLENIINKYNLCQRLGGFHTTKGSCFNYEIKQCEGACIQEETPELYNTRVQNFLDEYSYADKNMLVIDRGRDIEERSVVLIEEGKFKGFGFYNLNYQINNPEILKSIIRPMDNNRDSQHIIQSYLRKNKVLKIVNLKSNSVK
ncbi:exonuclease [Patiriisocius marinistellae]|uniref:Exonuclease n=1 Tax=Patiriisocius marinistellae TaxID=2494560 RepID=A0A5J4FZH5_9FLAO|nr:exonuclease domain-containing protein [Patiriisocius marinistellae]GEQ86642.1 exonuclease [Patiriisocius marinistellae]